MTNKIVLQVSVHTICFLFGALLISTAYAQDAGSVTGNVTCGRIGQNPCGYADLIILVQNLINFVVQYVIIPVMVFVILRAGVLLIVSGDKAAAKNDAKNSLKKAFIGLFFVLTAWLIVDGLISFFGVKVDSDVSKGPLKVLGN